MAKTKRMHYDDIGEVVFACSRRSKRISISVAPYRPVRVNFPVFVSIGYAKKYLEDNVKWVQGKIEKARLHEEKQSEKLADTLKPLDVEFEAKRLYGRLCELAVIYGYSFNKVTIRNQKTRWGSCSAADNINLNINLAKLPAHLLDYVILHELAHTKVKNHSPKFWQLLDTTTSKKAKILDKELSKYTIPRNPHHKGKC